MGTPRGARGLQYRLDRDLTARRNEFAPPGDLQVIFFWRGTGRGLLLRHMITRRDLCVAAVSIIIAVAGVALAESGGKPVMHSCVFNWADLKAVPTRMGERRTVFDAPTPSLAEFECHITTLNPGES